MKVYLIPKVTPQLIAFMYTLVYRMLLSGGGCLHCASCVDAYSDILKKYQEMESDWWQEIEDWYMEVNQKENKLISKVPPNIKSHIILREDDD